MKSLKIKYCALCLLITSAFVQNTNAQHKEYFPDPDTAIQHKLEEWQDMKFGLLMHWGPYSQWGIVESWSLCPEDVPWATGARIKQDSLSNYNTYKKNYENLKTTFNPVKFDPAKWAKAATNAGMKYVVFTTKHHDGFCMFDTKTTDYKITGEGSPFASNPKSDVTKEIFNAFRKESMWVGAYFSKPDWHSNYYWWDRFPPVDRNVNYPIKHYPQQWQKFVDYTYTQIDELMSNYGKVDILWLDGGWVRKKSDEEEKKDMAANFAEFQFGVNSISQDLDMPRLTKMARAKQPKLIVVDRAVPGEQQNYLTPEQHIPAEGLPYPWETCMTMANSWSYVPNDQYKPINELIEKLVDIVSKGGNYLLNIGPGPDGEIDATAYERLKDIGIWMNLNGKAIYGTRMYKMFGEGENIRFTQSKDGRTLNIFLFNYPQGTVHVKNVSFNAKSTVKLIGSNQKLKWKAAAEGVDIVLPASLKSVTDHVWVLQVQL